MICRSASSPRRTRTNSSTPSGMPTASVFGPTRAMLKSDRCHTGRPLMVRRSNCLSSAIVRTTVETLSRASTSRNSRGGEFSAVVSARVTRAASPGILKRGVCAAAPIKPGQVCSQKSSLRHFFGKSSRSKCSAFKERMASVSRGSHSRLGGD